MLAVGQRATVTVRVSERTGSATSRRARHWLQLSKARLLAAATEAPIMWCKRASVFFGPAGLLVCLQLLCCHSGVASCFKMLCIVRCSASFCRSVVLLFQLAGLADTSGHRPLPCASQWAARLPYMWFDRVLGVHQGPRLGTNSTFEKRSMCNCSDWQFVMKPVSDWFLGLMCVWHATAAQSWCHH